MPEKSLSKRYPTDLPAWKSLKTHYNDDMKSSSLQALFANDPGRADKFAVTSGDLLLDYSKNLLSGETRDLLMELAKEAAVGDAIEDLFAGVHVNVSEDRPALHVALRAKIADQVALGTPGVREVWHVLTRMEQFVSDIHAGVLRGHTGRRLTEIVNIGIGGSDLGPAMASRALRQFWRPGMKFHSVSNIDGTQLVDLTESLNPEDTLFVICSKTFTTQETMSNAQVAKEWITATLGEDALQFHFAAASSNAEAMDAFGVNADYRFGFWDWVGGRYSLWSAVGLSLALVIGMEHFQSLLAGARRMDRHFRHAPPEENMPLLLAMIAIWYNNFHGAETHAILPYDNRLDRFPAYLQQLQMESSGKGVRWDNGPVKIDTGQIIWGEAGSNAQHSFYQLLHQGTRLVPVDFILPVRSSGASDEQQNLSIAHCLAQSEALMDGHDTDDMSRRHLGNRPSSTLIFERLTPETLGQLIALYEHKVFVENVIWGVNAFDQFGVELGKKLANSLQDAVAGRKPYEGQNPSTRRLLERINRLRS